MVSECAFRYTFTARFTSPTIPSMGTSGRVGGVQFSDMAISHSVPIKESDVFCGSCIASHEGGMTP